MGYDFENNLIFGKVTEEEVYDPEVEANVLEYRTTPSGMTDVEIFVSSTSTDDIYTIDYVFEISDAIL